LSFVRLIYVESRINLQLTNKISLKFDFSSSLLSKFNSMTSAYKTTLLFYFILDVTQNVRNYGLLQYRNSVAWLVERWASGLLVIW